jgi:LysR family transcriptional regulator, cell division regulator
VDSLDLRFFEVVAQTQNLTRAAQVLNTVQSNVTGRIKRLESELGAALLSRHSRGVSLTDAGEALLPYALRVRQALEEAESSVGTKEAEKVAGVLRIGSLETVAAIRLPAILMRFADLYPKIDVVLRTGTSRELRDQVLAHRLDGAFVADRTGSAQFQEIRLWDEELVLAGPASFRGKASLSGMNEVRILVFRAGCSYRSYLEAFLTDSGVNSIRQVELGTLEGILGCVSAGMGITLLPKKVIEDSAYSRSLSIHKLKGVRPVVPTMFIRRANAYTSPALKCFLATAAGEATGK